MALNHSALSASLVRNPIDFREDWSILQLPQQNRLGSMQCDRCHTNAATVHIATLLYRAPAQEEHHLCPDCAGAFQASDPLLAPTPPALPAFSAKPVTSLSPKANAKVRAINTHLSELDPIIQRACSRHGYSFHAQSEIWPCRLIFVQPRSPLYDEVNRSLDLTTDLKLAELLEQGFSPDIPWSLYANASIFARPALSPRVLTEALFSALPFAEIPAVLEEQLERGFSLLESWTRDHVLAHGEIPQGRPKHLRGFPW